MSEPTVYDTNLQMYLDFVDRALAEEPSLFRGMCEIFGRLLGPRLEGARVLDLGCGEGYLSRFLAPLGPAAITGIDLSASLVEVARDRCDAGNVSFRVDDARTLHSVEDASVDVVVSQMAMMDIADHSATFSAVRRVITPAGAFVFSLLHPCFQSPTRLPDEPPFLTDEAGERIACLAWRYAEEGHFSSGGTGVRGHVGSYHRMLSTYANDLVGAGFRLERLEEPVWDVPGLFSRVPIVMIVAASPA
ncbi:MAG: class I SAM-dependent methyltransferase [Candidatus Binatia bacterium]